MIGEDTDGSDGYRFSSVVLDDWISTTPFGTNFFAQAFDQSGLGGVVRRTNLIL
jgi:hypothetical protein